MPEGSFVLGGCSDEARETGSSDVPAYLICLDDHVWNEREGSGVRE